MLPSKITVRNYRSFVGEHTFELRPLTLVYGGNNSGKSALLRIWPLIADSVRPGLASVLDMSSASLFEGGWSSLVWKGDPEEDDTGRFAFTLHWDSGILASATYEFDWPKGGFLYIEMLVLHARNGGRIEYGRSPVDAALPPTKQVYATDGDATNSSTIEFEGLVPVGWTSEGQLLAGLSEAMKALRDRVQWIHAPRLVTARRKRQPPVPRSKLAANGSDTLEALWSDPQLRGLTSKWFETTAQRKLRIIDEAPDEFRCVFDSVTESRQWAIDVVDSGTGLMQVLPIIAACELGRQSSAPLILPFEEPDGNLDVDAQIKIARYLVELATTKDHRLVLETHSPALMLGVQLALAGGGVLEGSDTLLYWTTQDDSGRSRAYPVELDDKGQITGTDNWPDPQQNIRDLSYELVSRWYSGEES